jgi:DNA-binding transcriptional LysR family regulator
MPRQTKAAIKRSTVTKSNPMNPYEDMRIFTQVMQAGSFTAAADLLGMSKQSVSRRLMQLEERLGVRLLNRSTRRLDATPLGQQYFDSAVRLLGEMQQAEQDISGQTQALRGTLRLSAPLSFAISHLGSLLTEFLQLHAQLIVEIDLSDRAVDLIGEGYDLALRIGTLEDSSLVARRIASIERVYCASPGYLAARGTPLEPEALREHDCLPYGHSRQVQWQFKGQGKTLHAIAVSGRMRANNGELLRDAAIAGMGVTYLPAFIVEQALADGRLVKLLEAWTPPRLQLSAVYPQHRQIARPVQAFVEFLRERL